jgi:hypothetical protein
MFRPAMALQLVFIPYPLRKSRFEPFRAVRKRRNRNRTLRYRFSTSNGVLGFHRPRRRFGHQLQRCVRECFSGDGANVPFGLPIRFGNLRPRVHAHDEKRKPSFQLLQHRFRQPPVLSQPTADEPGDIGAQFRFKLFNRRTDGHALPRNQGELMNDKLSKKLRIMDRPALFASRSSFGR